MSDYQRGSYAPLDRDRHWVTAWAVDRAGDRAYARALSPVMPAVETALLASRGVRGARAAYHGFSAFQDHGDTPVAVVGGTWFHSVADRARAIAQITTGIRGLAADLAAWHTANADAANASSAAQWLVADVTPTLEEWNAFAARESGSWWTRAATSWEAFEDWQDRLKRLRELARAHGIVLQSGEPPPLPMTIWQKGAEGKGTEAAAWLGVLKLVVFGAIGVTGAVTLYSVLREMHRKASPDQEDSCR